MWQRRDKAGSSEKKLTSKLYCEYLQQASSHPFKALVGWKKFFSTFCIPRSVVTGLSCFWKYRKSCYWNGTKSHFLKQTKSHFQIGTKSHFPNGTTSHFPNGITSHLANETKSDFHGTKSHFQNGTKSHFHMGQNLNWKGNSRGSHSVR